MKENPLRKWRHQQGLTEPDVAETLGVTRAAINNWEHGRAYPRPRFFSAIADMMGMRLGTLTEKWAEWQEQEEISVKS